MSRILNALCLTVVAGSIAALAAACTRLQLEQQHIKLEVAVTRYMSAVRWGHFGTASAYIRRKESPERPVDARLLEGIRVTSFVIGGTQLSEDVTNILIPVTISYYHTDDGRVHTLLDHQQWWYLEEEKQWFLDGNLPDFAGGLALPGR